MTEINSQNSEQQIGTGLDLDQKFSSRDENFAPDARDPDLATGEANALINHSRPTLEQSLEVCRKSALAYSACKSESDKRARAHLVDVARMVFSSGFDLTQVATLLGRKVTKPALKNPFCFLLAALLPNRDSKVVNKQAKALQFAAEKSDRDMVRLEAYFEEHSIKSTYNDYLKAKRSQVRPNGNAFKKVKMVVSGLPQDFRGVALVQLRVLNGELQVLSVVEHPTADHGEVAGTPTAEEMSSGAIGTVLQDTGTVPGDIVPFTKSTAAEGTEAAREYCEPSSSECHSMEQNTIDAEFVPIAGLITPSTEKPSSSNLRPFGRIGLKPVRWEDNENSVQRLAT